MQASGCWEMSLTTNECASACCTHASPTICSSGYKLFQAYPFPTSHWSSASLHPIGMSQVNCKFLEIMRHNEYGTSMPLHSFQHCRPPPSPPTPQAL